MFLIEKRPMGVLHLFSIKNIFHDKMDFRLFYFHVTICSPCRSRATSKIPPQSRCINISLSVHLRSYSFLSPKTIKKQTSSAWNFLQHPMQVYSRCLKPLFQNKRSHLHAPLFFKEYFNLHVMINKMINEHSVDYDPKLPGLTLRMHTLLFL